MTILGREFTKADARRVLWTAGQAAFGAAVVAYPVLTANMKSNTKAAAVAFVASVGGAAVAALLSAVKNWFLADTSPIK
jgi:hypothetical protein